MSKYVNQKEADELNAKVYERGLVDREHLMKFLTLIDSNDAKHVIEAVQEWLNYLHNDPKFDKITFPRGDIDAIIGDLDSYGRIQPEHLAEFKAQSNKSLPIS